MNVFIHLIPPFTSGKIKMNKTTLSIALGLCLITGSAVGKNNQLTLEQRMEQLEARLAAAESRATVAEGQVRDL